MKKSIDSLKGKTATKTTPKNNNKKPKSKSQILTKIKKQSDRKFKLSKKQLLMIGIITTAIAVFLVYCLVQRIVLADKIYPNVWLASNNVGGMILNDAEKNLENQSNQYLKTDNLELRTDTKTYQLKPNDLGVKYNAGAILDKLMSIGHKQNFIVSGITRLGLIFKPKKMAADFSWDQETWKNNLNEIAKEVDIPFQNATLKFEDGQIVEVPSSAGKKVDQVKSEKDVKIASWINFKVIPSSKVLGESTGTANANSDQNKISEESKKILQAQLDETKINDYIAQLALKIDVAAQDAGVSFANGRPTVTKPSVVGRAIDRKQLYTDLVDAIKNDDYKKVKIKIVTTLPKVREDNLLGLGLVELIAEGISSFGGSPRNRIHNIKTGAAKFNGVLISPGEEFSFNEHLGSVNASTGFLPELVIKENKTIPEYGGGLCQVSTTAFRAALLAGFTILERKEHAYRVKYYEWPYGPGVDATIYPPHPDLKFKNDTDYYVLIQTKTVGTKIIFDFYSTKAGRFAVINKPKVLWSKPDGSMGALFTRDVFQNGKLVRSDVFKTLYKSPSLYPRPVVETGAPVQQ